MTSQKRVNLGSEWEKLVKLLQILRKKWEKYTDLEVKNGWLVGKIWWICGNFKV